MDVAGLQRALVGWWRLRTEALGGRVAEHDGLVTCLTGIPAASLTPTLTEREPEHPVDALAAAAAEYPPGIGFGIELDPTYTVRLRAALVDAGLTLLDARPTMTASPAAVAAADPPNGVTLGRGEDRLDELAVVDAEAFGDDLAITRAWSAPRVFDGETFRAYVAVEDGHVVAEAATGLVDGVLVISGVGTAEVARRRGIGAAITSFAVRDRADEAHTAFLTSSRIGFGVYERLGFRTVTSFEIWVA